jgi:hypothetical protein
MAEEKKEKPDRSQESIPPREPLEESRKIDKRDQPIVTDTVEPPPRPEKDTEQKK